MKKKKYSKQHTQFIVSITLVGVLFIAAIVGVLSGKFRPFASQDTTPENGTPLTITGGRLEYKDLQGNALTAPINDLIVNVIEPLAAQFALQGVGNKHNALGEVAGDLTILRANGNVDNQTDVLFRKHPWKTNKANSANTRSKVGFGSSVRNRLDNGAGAAGAFDFVIKPKYYLAKKVTNVTNLDQSINFSPTDNDVIYAGDVVDTGEDYNKVSRADLSLFLSNYNKTVESGANAITDFNRDGTVDRADLSILLSNYNRTGENL